MAINVCPVTTSSPISASLYGTGHEVGRRPVVGRQAPTPPASAPAAIPAANTSITCPHQAQKTHARRGRADTTGRGSHEFRLGLCGQHADAEDYGFEANWAVRSIQSLVLQMGGRSLSATCSQIRNLTAQTTLCWVVCGQRLYETVARCPQDRPVRLADHCRGSSGAA